MKRIFKYIFSLLLISSIASTALHARQISPENAKQNAAAAVQKQNKKKKAVGLSDSSQLILRETVKDDSGNPLFYIFSRGENAGYVIAAADDRVKPVLAISHKGNFSSVENLPAPTRYLLDTYSHEITSVFSEEETAAHSEEIYREPIDELLTSWWGQDKPFNNQCPIISGERAPVGCVGLATAMMLNYYQYPSAGTGTFTYTSNGASQTYSLEENPFDYDKIIEYYTGDIDDYETRESQDAVANLCLGAALALGSNFRVDGTASSLSSSVFSNYFHYPKEGLGLLKRDYFSIEEWESIVYEELAAGRPVAYEGDDGTKGHAFVIDGYDDGLFHINWGWYGDSDDYFSLSALRPGTSGIGGNSDSNYSFNQGIVRGLRTPEDNPASPLFIASQFGFDPLSNIFSLTSLSSKSGWQRIKTGIELENIESGAITATVGSIDGSQTTVTQDEQKYTNFSVDFSGIADGVYRARPMIQLDGSEESYDFNDWYRVYCFLKNSRYVDVEVKDGKIVNAKEGSDVNYDIHFTNFQVQIPIMTSLNYRGFTMDVQNNGNTFLARVNKLIYYPDTDEIVPNSDGGRETVALEPGTKKTLNMSVNTNLKVAGEYDMQIVDYDNPEIKYSDRIRFKMINSNSYSTVDGLRYIIVSEDPKTVLLYGGTFEGEVTVPETVTIKDSEYTVKYVGLNVGGMTAKLKKLVLPNSVESISPSAFMGCSGLEEVVLPAGLKYLGGNSFGSCTSLQKVNIPTGITEIYTNTFTKTALSDIDIPEGITSIGKYAFSQTKLKNITLPSTLRSMDQYAFGNVLLSEIIVNSPVPPEISNVTFYSGIYNTANLFVPEGSRALYQKDENWKRFKSLFELTSDEYFEKDGIWYDINPDRTLTLTAPREGMYNMSTLTIPASVEYKGFNYKVVEIGDNAFKDIKTITRVLNSASLVRIGAHAFENTGISSTLLSEATEEVGDYAFHNTDIGTLSRFTSNLKRIGKYAYAGNKRLTFYKALNGANWLEFPEGLESIGDGAFEGCEALDKLQFSSNVELGENVFAGCSALESFCLANTSISRELAGKLASELETTHFYIYSNDREYFEDMFTRPSQLYDILSIQSIDWEGKPEVRGITQATITFDSNLGNPAVSNFIMKDERFRDIGSVIVDNTDRYATDGTMTIKIAPSIEGSGHIQINFVQSGLGINFDINVVERANLIQEIELSNATLSLTPNQTVTLETVITPADPEDTQLVWTTSNTSVATVNEDGEVTAVGIGTATITCKALMGTASAKCTVTVTPAIRPGKALDEDNPYAPVTVADIVAIANHIMGDTHERFNEKNADANGDGKITVSDVSTTVQIILDQEDSSEEALLRVKALSEESEVNFLHFSEIIFENSNLLVNFASLEAMEDFTALQADIICPVNVEISNIELDNLSSHTLSWKKLNNGNYRVVIYSLSNGLLPVSPTPILKLSLNKVGNPSGAMSVNNAWISTPEATKSPLCVSGGSIGIPTGIGTLYSDFPEAYADVFTVDGTLLKRNAEVKNLKNELAPGIYILRGLNSTSKVLLK